MCGITGFLGGVADPERVLGQMTRAIQHRGPDGAGHWFDLRSEVALGHRRLAIQDLSIEGAQPMHSDSGRYVMVFNGEVFNHLDLRTRLGGNWRGHSDTETMLRAIEKWGVREAVTQFVGMFAFALWDRETSELTLARDRLGIKPLYFGRVGQNFVFGSELKAFKSFPGFDPKVDRRALSAYMRSNCVPQPLCIYEDFSQMSPGTLLIVKGGKTRVERYWSAREVVRAGIDHFLIGSPDDIVNGLESILEKAVQDRLLSDVPLGAFLSGGVDSSTVVALMRKHQSSVVRTFSIGFEDDAYDEAVHARAVARHLGTEHTELVVTAADALEIVPRLATMYDEPFADSSQIPTFLVSRLAREHVTVSLSGDGGDELFAGYNRHVFGPKIWKVMGRLPVNARRLVAKGLTAVSAGAWDHAFGLLERALPSGVGVRLPTEKLQKFASVLPAKDQLALYETLVTHWSSDIVRGGESHPVAWSDLGDFASSMMLTDLETYLPDDILTKVDRASMAVSLEARVPLLDHRVVEYAWRMPHEFKIRDGQSKWALRQVLYRHVPREMIERPKMGFGVPIDAWLRGPLRGWAEELLSKQRLEQDGYFDASLIRTRWHEHLGHVKNWQHHLWDVLMFQAWLDQNT